MLNSRHLDPLRFDSVLLDDAARVLIERYQRFIKNLRVATIHRFAGEGSKIRKGIFEPVPEATGDR